MEPQTPSPSLPDSAQPAPPRNWWQRNWKWFLPVGCLGIVVLGLGGVAAIVFSVFGVLRNSEVHREALDAAREHPGVVERIGSPVEAGWFVSGNISVEGGGGEADLAIPVSGPSGSGTLHAEAERSAGAWSFTALEFTDSATGDQIDLLADAGLPSRTEADAPAPVAAPEPETDPGSGDGPSFYDFYFAQEAPDGELAEVLNLFEPGDSFVMVFTDVGPFQTDDEGYSRLEVALEVRDPERRTVLESPELFGEAGRALLREGIAPSVLVEVSTSPEWPTVEYTATVVIHDLLAGTRTVRNTVFTLE